MKIGEKVLEHLKKHPESLNMDYHLVKEPACGTVGCLAGHIVALSNVPLEEVQVWASSGEEGQMCQRTELRPAAHVGFEIRPCFADTGWDEIERLARELWARDYGVKSAESLPFYGEAWEDEADVDFKLEDITAAQVIDFLREHIKKAEEETAESLTCEKCGSPELEVWGESGTYWRHCHACGHDGPDLE